jgi:hypothetical protein
MEDREMARSDAEDATGNTSLMSGAEAQFSEMDKFLEEERERQEDERERQEDERERQAEFEAVQRSKAKVTEWLKKLTGASSESEVGHGKSFLLDYSDDGSAPDRSVSDGDEVEPPAAAAFVGRPPDPAPQSPALVLPVEPLKPTWRARKAAAQGIRPVAQPQPQPYVRPLPRLPTGSGGGGPLRTKDPDVPQPTQQPSWQPPNLGAGYPRELTKKYWNERMGARGKLAGSTGLGAALEKFQESYNAVNWKIFHPNPPLPFSFAAWNDVIVATKAQVAAQAKTMETAHEAGVEVIKVATTAKGKISKSKFAPGNKKDICDEIIADTKVLMKHCEMEGADEYIENVNKKKIEQRMRNAKTTVDGLIGVPHKIIDCIVGFENAKEITDFKEVERSKLRPITQIVLNALTLFEAGFEISGGYEKVSPFSIDIIRCREIMNIFRPYVNDLVVIGIDDLEFHRERMVNLLREMQ